MMKVKAPLISAVCLVSFAAVSGCAPKPEDQLVGKWTYSSLDAGGATGPGADMAKKQMAGSTIEFTKDKSCTMTAGGKPAFSGKWTMSDRQISIVPTMVGGQTVEQAKARIQQIVAQNPQLAKSPAFAKAMESITKGMKASLSADGKTVKLESNADNGGSASFTKNAGS